jgi:LysM repeat protein
MPDDDTPQTDEQPADDQPAEQSDEQPGDSDQPAEQSEEQPTDSDQPAEPSEEQPTDSDQPAEPSEEQPTDSDQPAEPSEEQPTDSDQPSEQSEEQPSDSDQAAEQPEEQPTDSEQPADQSIEQPAEGDQPAGQAEEQPTDTDQPATAASADDTVAFAGGDAPPNGGGGSGSGGSRPSKDVIVKNERAPADPLPADFEPKGFVKKHRVSDGEDWASVAKKYNVDVKALIYFNFHTNNPDEVNWYLRRNTGCNVSKDGGVNWAFSSSAYPGFIYIPPSKVIDMEPEKVTVRKPVMQRIQEIAHTIDGGPGIRIREMLTIESLADPYQPFPGTGGKQRLWYYTPGAVTFYINLNTKDPQRREMTKATNGQFPFDGDIGPGFQRIHEWRIYPFGDIVARDARVDVYADDPLSDSYLKIWLEGTEKEIYDSWQEMASIDPRAEFGNAWGPLVNDFLKHVHDLAATPRHLYYFYQHDT